MKSIVINLINCIISDKYINREIKFYFMQLLNIFLTVYLKVILSHTLTILKLDGYLFFNFIFMVIPSYLLIIFPNFLIPTYLLNLSIIMFFGKKDKENEIIFFETFVFFKSITQILVIICIFACDFNNFPMFYRKTENYGYSLMDLGIGMHLIYTGLSVYSKDKILNFKNAIKLIFMGVFRLILLKSINYNVIITEYGRYFNFYIISGVSILVYCTIPQALRLFAAFLFLFMHFFNIFLFKDELFSVFRDDIISDNKEGLFIIFPSIAIILFLSKYREHVENKKKTNHIFIVISTLFLISNICEKPSRKLFNLSYITFIFFISLILPYLLNLLNFYNRTRIPILFSFISMNLFWIFNFSNILVFVFNYTFYLEKFRPRLIFLLNFFYLWMNFNFCPAYIFTLI